MGGSGCKWFVLSFFLDTLAALSCQMFVYPFKYYHFSVEFSPKQNIWRLLAQHHLWMESNWSRICFGSHLCPRAQVFVSECVLVFVVQFFWICISLHLCDVPPSPGPSAVGFCLRVARGKRQAGIMPACKPRMGHFNCLNPERDVPTA